MGKNNSFEQDEIIIDVGELIAALWRKKHIIILVGMLCATIAFCITKMLIVPQYDSVTKIYVISKQNEDAVTYSDLQTGTQLTKDYIEMVKSRPVLEEVISALDLKIEPKDLADAITVEATEDTRIIKITVRNAEPKMARDIANEVREVASVQIQDVMNIDAVNMVEDANLPTVKATPHTMANTILGGGLGVALVMGIILLLSILDDTIKTSDDVEKYLELNVLALLPLKEGNQKNKKTKAAKTQKTKQSNKKRK